MGNSGSNRKTVGKVRPTTSTSKSHFTKTSDEPELDVPESDRAVSDRPDLDRLESVEPESDRAESNRSKSDRAESDRSKSDRAESDRAESDRAEPDSRESDGLRIKKVTCKMVHLSADPSAYVKLNVGGHLFQTTVGVLCRYDSMLRRMFSGLHSIQRDESGFVLIDRSGKYFDKILNFLRDGTVPLFGKMDEVSEIRQEALYYLIQELTDFCDARIANLLKIQSRGIAGDFSSSCILLVNKEEEVKQIAKANQGSVIIEWLLNRKNTKLPFANNHAEQVTKNFEYFAHLGRVYSDHAIFVFNCGVGSSEICRWTIYANGGKDIYPVECVNQQALVQLSFAPNVRPYVSLRYPLTEIYRTLTAVLSNKLAVVQALGGGDV